MKRDVGIFEMSQDPERADALLWERRTDPGTRRGFLKTLGLAAMGAALGAAIPFSRHMPAGYVPAAFADDRSLDDAIAEKHGLRILNDRPFNAETPPWTLDEEFTSNARHFVRNNGLPPEVNGKSLIDWRLVIDGEVDRPLQLSLADLKHYPIVERALVIECAGNGRASFRPRARGNQWTIGAVGCAVYRGVRLRDVLNHAVVKSSAVYTGYYGADRHLSGDSSKPTISRGTPIAKALDEGTLLAFEMNGEPLPLMHGAPVRLICPGWPGSTGGKWLRRITIRDRVHDGPKMTGMSYRVPATPVAPGTEVSEADMRIIERMPVKSVITSPRSGGSIAAGAPLDVRGHAWSGERTIQAVHVSVDFGATWKACEVKPPRNAHAWQRWTARLSLPERGYYEVWARATDSEGEMQPMVVPGWNPRGYLNNAMHRISVKVT